MRRQAILDTAADMLAEMPVVDLGLNELARRVCLAKSNVLRYFESREAVLLELLDLRYRDWIAAVTPLLADHAGDLRTRRDRLVAALVSSLAKEPMLCDLVNAQAAILERNISAEVAARYKHKMLDATAGLVAPVERLVPEFGADGAMKFCAAALLSAGALWSHSNPAPAMLAAYEQHPELAAARLEFVPILTELLEVLARGLLTRD
ncbi:TetR/AcrR family transcriptional regulator [Nocardia sp. NPDC006630]|uniref:TetR/AcrR family transcriptional regulator n=1 Tax=Nocardia sp. NPDC006630 TaxID=3157181 RepID=UPI0033A949FD